HNLTHRSPLPEDDKAGPAGRATTRGDPPPRGDAATPPRPRPPHHPPAPQPVTPHAPPTPEHTNDTAPAPPQAPNRQTSRPAPPDEDERTSNPGPCTTGSPCCLFLAAASWRPRSENFGQAPIPARYPTAGYTLSNDESRGGRPDVETVVRPDRHPPKPGGRPPDDPGPGRPCHPDRLPPGPPVRRRKPDPDRHCLRDDPGQGQRDHEEGRPSGDRPRSLRAHRRRPPNARHR